MKFRRLALAGAVVTAIGIVAAQAAGLWPLLPLIGGASSTLTQGGTTFSVPAGPATLTGLETVPIDTNVAGGAGPATALATPCHLGMAVTKTVVAVAAGSDTMTNNVCVELLVPAGTIASFTVTMPPAPLDGQIYRITSTQTVTALTVSANTGQSMAGTTPTALTPSATSSTGYAWVFKAAAQGGQAANSWYRIQ